MVNFLVLVVAFTEPATLAFRAGAPEEVSCREWALEISLAVIFIVDIFISTVPSTSTEDFCGTCE